MEVMIAVFMAIVTGVLIFLGVQSGKQETQKVQERITTLSKPEEKKVQLIRKKQLENSFVDRALLPFAKTIFEKTQEFIPLTSKSWVKSKLIQAGYQKPQYQQYFLGIQILCTALLFGLLFTITMLFGKFGGAISVTVSVVFGLIGYGLPMIWLQQEAGKRQTSIQKSLADFLDLLVICVESGLGLDHAINKSTTLKSVKTSHYLREELLIYMKDVGLGKPRKEALLDLAKRTGVDDLNAVIAAIVQSYDMGTGIATTLRVQSDSLRVKRLMKAEEKANQIPVKMVIPIYVFLFPSIFVAIMGPIAVILIEAVSAILGNDKLG